MIICAKNGIMTLQACMAGHLLLLYTNYTANQAQRMSLYFRFQGASQHPKALPHGQAMGGSGSEYC